MSRLFAALVCLAAIPVVLAAPVPTHLMPQDTPPPLDFPTARGTTWVYEGDYGKRTVVVTEVQEEKDGAKLVTTEKIGADGKRTPYLVTRISAEGVFVVAEGRRKYDEPWCILKLPHRPGRTWQTEVSGNGPAGIATMKTGPIEKVTVAAGTFLAARVEWELKYKGGGRKATCWYAHGVGLIQMDENMKLTTFTLGKD
jgi:hypothetical protein